MRLFVKAICWLRSREWEDCSGNFSSFFGSLKCLPRWELASPFRRYVLIRLLAVSIRTHTVPQILLPPIEADTKNCRVDVSLPESIQLKGNHETLYRAIENVVRNAVLHSPESSRVSIVVKQDTSSKQTSITITDQGSGVPSSQLESIFQPFFRSTTNSKKLGYGLGLAITQRVVQAHGGCILAKNLPSAGFEISITLPVFELFLRSSKPSLLHCFFRHVHFWCVL